MSLFGSTTAIIPDGRLIRLTPKNVDALAERTRDLLDGRRLDCVSDHRSGRRWSASGLHLASVTVGTYPSSPPSRFNGLCVCLRRHDETGVGTPLHGLNYDQHPRLTFGPDGLIIDSTAGRTQISITD